MTNASIHHIIKPTDLLPSSSTIGTARVDDQDTPQNHQYECIPEYLLTMTRHRPTLPTSIVCHHQTNCICTTTTPYTNFSRLYLTPKEITTTTNTSESSQCTCSPPPSTNAIVQEESSTPLLTTNVSKESHRRIEPSKMIGWTRRTPSSTEKRHGLLSQLRKSSLL